MMEERKVRDMQIEKEAQELANTLLKSGVPADAECVYNGRNQLYTLQLPCGEKVNIKSFKRPGVLKGLIYGIFSTPKAEKSYRNAQRLRELGFDTPAPYAYAVERLWGGLRIGHSYYICRQLENFSEIRWWERRSDKQQMVDALGEEMKRLYEAGVLLRDFSPGNVLLVGTDPYRFAYVDVNRTDFGVRSKRRMMSMFKRINIVPEETERLARSFARAMRWDEDDTARRALNILHRFLWKKDSFLKPLKRAIGLSR